MGKGGDSAVPKKEVLIDGRLYDVSNLKHPGGGVINFYAGSGIDATQAFANFHIRSKKAKKVMEHLPNRAVDKADVKKNSLPGQSELMKDFDELTRDLESEGFFKPALGHVVFRITELLVLYCAGFWLLLNQQILVGLILLGIAQGRCGWLMHEGGHYSLTGVFFFRFF